MPFFNQGAMILLSLDLVLVFVLLYRSNRSVHHSGISMVSFGQSGLVIGVALSLLLLFCETVLVWIEKPLSDWYLDKKSEQIEKTIAAYDNTMQGLLHRLGTSADLVNAISRGSKTELERILAVTASDQAVAGPVWIELLDDFGRPLVWSCSDSRLPPFLPEEVRSHVLEKGHFLYRGSVFIIAAMSKEIEQTGYTMFTGWVIDQSSVEKAPVYTRALGPVLRSALGPNLTLLFDWNPEFYNKSANQFSQRFGLMAKQRAGQITFLEDQQSFYHLGWTGLQAGRLLRSIRFFRMTFELVLLVIVILDLMILLLKKEVISGFLIGSGVVLTCIAVSGMSAFLLRQGVELSQVVYHLLPHPGALDSAVPSLYQFLYSCVLALSITLLCIGLTRIIFSRQRSSASVVHNQWWQPISLIFQNTLFFGFAFSVIAIITYSYGVVNRIHTENALTTEAFSMFEYFSSSGYILSLVTLLNSYLICLGSGFFIVLWQYIYFPVLRTGLKKILIIACFLVVFALVFPFISDIVLFSKLLALSGLGYFFYSVWSPGSRDKSWSRKMVRLNLVLLVLVLIVLMLYTPYFMSLVRLYARQSLLDWVMEEQQAPRKCRTELIQYTDQINSILPEIDQKIAPISATGLAAQLWLSSPFPARNQAFAVEVFSSSHQLIGRYGFNSKQLIRPELTNLQDLSEPFPQIITSGELTRRFLTRGIPVQLTDEEMYIVLFHVEYNSFPHKSKLKLWPEHIPPEWLAHQHIRRLDPVIETEYRGGIVYTSESQLYVGPPHEPRFLVKLYESGYNWHNDLQLGDKIYDVLFVVPEAWGNAPDLISYALPLQNRTDRWAISYHIFMLATILLIIVMLVIVSSRIVFSLYHQYNTDVRYATFPTFRTKILLALVLCSIIPLVVVSMIFKQTVTEKLKENILTESRQAAETVLERLKDRSIMAGTYLAERFIRTEVIGPWPDDIDFNILREQWSVIFAEVYDSQGFRLWHWADQSPEDLSTLSERDEMQRAQSFQRNTAVFSYNQVSHNFYLTTVLPLIDPIRPHFPAGTVTIKVLLTDSLLNEINNDAYQLLVVYDRNKPMVMSDRSLHVAGLVPDLLPSGIQKALSTMQENPVFELFPNTTFSQLDTYVAIKDNLGNITGVFLNSRCYITAKLFQETVSFFRVIIASIFPLLLIIIIVVTYMSYRFYQPMKLLLDGTHTISSGRLEHLIAAVPDREFNALISSFNAMTDDLRRDRTQLEHRKQFMEAILQNVTTGILVFDGHDVLTAINKAVLTLFHLAKADELLGKSKKELMENKNFTFLAELDWSRERKEPCLRQLTLPLSNKNHILQVSLSQFGSVELETSGWIVAIEDMTELITTNKQAALVDMARQVAHEVKNPLTPIQLSTEHILHTYHDRAENFKDILEQCTTTILMQINNLNRIINDFSNFARLPSLKRQQEDLNQIISDLVRTHNMGPESVDSSRIEFTPTACPLEVFIDRGLMEQVFLNLIRNAKQAMPVNGILKITTGKGRFFYSGPLASQHIELGTEQSIWISFEDNGPGISQDHLLRLFEPYFSTKDKGFGLGLSISKRTVREHGGEIFVFSESNVGALFVIILPQIVNSNP